jgi:DNA polymerase-3 subunit beta
VHDDLLSIGALARAGGPPVSALRFYDAAGVLRPAHVDPATGYRWYTTAQVHTARLIASLRQAGLPVIDLVALLEAPDEARAVLARHRRRLEEDLVSARAHLDAAEDILAQPGCCSVVAKDVVAAVEAVRHAVGGADPAWPGLAGVLLHLDGTTLRLVACDRSRVAVATVPVQQPCGPPVRVVAPLALLDRVVAGSLPDVGRVVLSARSLEILGLRGEPLDAAYPVYEQLLRSGESRRATVTSEELVQSIDGADDIVVVRLDAGQVDLAPPGAGDTFGFSRTFLLDAVRAARTDHLALTLDERFALSVAPADRPQDIGLMMPIRLQH